MRWRVRQDSNLQQPDLESGALPIGATDPIPLHLDLAMQSMRAARSAKLFKGKLFGSLFSVFCRSVILAFTLIASKSYEFPHNRNLSQQALLKNFGNDPSANGSSAFANSELEPVIHGHRCNQFDFDIDVIAGHDHFSAFR